MLDTTNTLSVTAAYTLLEACVKAPGQMTVTGEVSAVTTSGAGHSYFTLKDQVSQLRCVMFAGAVKRSSLTIREGNSIVVAADASIYAKTGNLQLVVQQAVEIEQQGALHAQFLALKKRLTEEGLFDDTHKQLLPKFPERIGVITSTTGAVRHDIEITLRRRFPYATLIIFACSVQGEQAVSSVCAALDTAQNYQPPLSCLIIARGGGSLNDLQAFNDETLVRGLYACQIPIVSAVGHQTDVTLCDFVADVRAATPTAAAELIAPAQEELLLYLDEQAKYLTKQLDYQLTKYKQTCELFSAQLDRTQEVLIRHENSIAILTERLKQRMTYYINHANSAVHEVREKLAVHNPYNFLRRGFAHVTTDDNQPVTGIAQLASKQTINLRMHDGNATARILNSLPAGDR